MSPTDELNTGLTNQQKSFRICTCLYLLSVSNIVQLYKTFPGNFNFGHFKGTDYLQIFGFKDKLCRFYYLFFAYSVYGPELRIVYVLILS